MHSSFNVMLFCFSVAFMILNQIYLGSAVLVKQNENIAMAQKGFILYT